MARKRRYLSVNKPTWLTRIHAWIPRCCRVTQRTQRRHRVPAPGKSLNPRENVQARTADALIGALTACRLSSDVGTRPPDSTANRRARSMQEGPCQPGSGRVSRGRGGVGGRAVVSVWARSHVSASASHVRARNGDGDWSGRPNGWRTSAWRPGAYDADPAANGSRADGRRLGS
jgi:hypothetical protein